MKDLISTKDLLKDDFKALIAQAKHFKELNSSEAKQENKLAGKSVIQAFFENSTRTRMSFELSAKRLGCDSTSLSPAISSAAKGESLLDTIKNLEAMQNDFFVIRHQKSGAAKFVAGRSKAHVINAGDGCNEHPTQALLDLFTMSEHFGAGDAIAGFESISGKKISIIGDIFHSRVARSNIYALQTLGAEITLFGPPQCLRYAEVFGSKRAKNIKEALNDADAVIMLRIQLERSEDEVPLPNEYAKYFGLNASNIEFLPPHALVLHPGPVNRGVEMSSEVMDSRSLVLEQTQNGVAMRMAVFSMLAQS